MITQETLLRMDSIAALKAMAIDIFDSDFDQEWLEVFDVSASSIGEPTKTLATVFFNGAYAPTKAVAIEPLQFYYDRLHLSDFFEGVDKNVAHRMGATALDIMRDFALEYRIPFRESDVVNALYTDFGSIVIQAGAKSPRWIGSIILNSSEYVPDINEFISVREYNFPFDGHFSSSRVREKLATYINLHHSDRLPILLIPDMFSIDVERLVSIAPNDSIHNTRVILPFTSGYGGELEVVYSRRSFPKTYRWPVKLYGSGGISVENLLIKLSDSIGVYIAPDDVELVSVPTLAVGETKVFHIPFKPSSLAFVGEIWVEYERRS